MVVVERVPHKRLRVMVTVSVLARTPYYFVINIVLRDDRKTKVKESGLGEKPYIAVLPSFRKSPRVFQAFQFAYM